jgi:protein-disulfide isomerase
MGCAVATLLALALAVASCQRPSSRPLLANPAGADAGSSLPCRTLSSRLCAQFGQVSDVCALAGEETRTFASERCAAMLARYEQTASSALRFTEGQRTLRAHEQTLVHSLAPSLGPPDAPVTLVVFADFDDGDCARASPMATTIKNLYSDRVRLVFRQFPLAVHPNAHLAAEASLAAHAQGKFWAFHDLLFGNPQAHDRAALDRYAREAGLDCARFRKALDQRSFATDVDADIDLGHKLGIDAVPAVFANGRRALVPYGVDELSRLVGGSADNR